MGFSSMESAVKREEFQMLQTIWSNIEKDSISFAYQKREEGKGKSNWEGMPGLLMMLEETESSF